MNFICPEINDLVLCFACGSQTLPPYRLCESGHLGCQPCSVYRRACDCGQPYVTNSHYVFDGLVSALLLKCKYAASSSSSSSSSGDGGGTCDGQWYDVHQLRDHYRNECTKNAYTCPIAGCGRVHRIDTVVEHYETAHETHPRCPIADDLDHKVIVRIPITMQGKEINEVFKIFNGYFMFIVTPLRGLEGNYSAKLTIRNINPTDPLQYMCSASATMNEITAILYLNNSTVVEYDQARDLSASSDPSPDYLSIEDDKAFLWSCYSAASIYFFTKNYDLAWNVLEDGINLIEWLLDHEQLKKLTETNKQELSVWSVLYQTMIVDLTEYTLDDKQQILLEKNKLTEKENELANYLTQMDQLHKDFKVYPSEYLLLYRGYFLDKDFDRAKEEKFSKLVQNLSISSQNPEYLNKNIYYYLKLYDVYINEFNDKFTAFYNIIDAVKMPTLSIEDRLLNNKANQLAFDEIQYCINGEKWIVDNDNEICTELSELRIKDTDLDDILNKYTHMKVYNYKDIILKLKLFIKDDIINEDLLYNIVTSAIDMDVYNDEYNAKIENVKTAIELLNAFITAKTKIIRQTKYKIKQKPDDKEGSNNEEIKRKTVMGKIVKAYKWLAELNAVLCSDPKDENLIKYQSEFKVALDKAVELSINQDKSNKQMMPIDNHLEYLKYKLKCKTILQYKPWENLKRSDGWIVKKIGLLRSLYNSATDEVGECYSKILTEEALRSRYVHQVDVLILKFRYWFYKGNLNECRNVIQKALSKIVVTSEDRYRNLEAHELSSMFLLLENGNIIKNNSYYEEPQSKMNRIFSDEY